MMRALSNLFHKRPNRTPPPPLVYHQEQDPIVQAVRGLQRSMQAEAQETKRAVRQIQVERERRGNMFSDAMTGNRDNRNGGS